MLCIENGKCLEPLFFYDNESGKAIPTEYEDVFEYLVKVGLKKNFPQIGRIIQENVNGEKKKNR